MDSVTGPHDSFVKNELYIGNDIQYVFLHYVKVAHMFEAIL